MAIFPPAIGSLMKAVLLLTVVLWMGIGLKSAAQTQALPPVLFNEQPTTLQPITLGANTSFYEDKSGDTLPLSVIRQKTFLPFSAKRNERTTQAERSLQATWLRFAIRNTHPTDTLHFYLYPGITELTNVYENNRSLGTTGVYTVPTPDRPYRHFLSIAIPPGQQNTYWIRSVILISTPSPVGATLYTAQAADQKLRVDTVYLPSLLLVMGILIGCLLFMGIYAAYHYVLSRDLAFLYYALYVTGCFLMALAHVDIRFGLAWLYPYLPNSRFPLSIPLIFAFYILFIQHMLAVKTQYPRLARWLTGLFLLLLAQQGITLLEFFQHRPLFASNVYYQYMLIPSAITLLLLLGLIGRSRSPIKTYLLMGSLSLVFISLVPSLINFYFFHVSYLGELFLNYIQFWANLGLVLECICFAFALAYRSRLVELEKNQLQQDNTHQLEVELIRRTQEIEAKNRELEIQHIRQLETAFEQKVAETEMTALRAQMNPHFIFNCLNSIKFFTTQNNGALASDYLTKFSRLIRRVLENSRSQQVTLQNELEALELYLEMESLRFNHKLTYQIHLDPSIDTEFIEIPPLLVQPYVENAIWHGLMHKKEGGTVVVRIGQLAIDTLQVTITDDGIGRQRAAELKSKSATRHKSFGMKVTSERIQLINQLYQSHTQVQVHDLVDRQGKAAGTEVVITIPI
jgi:sensor histidine kinase YesM